MGQKTPKNKSKEKTKQKQETISRRIVSAWGGCSRTIFLAPPSDLQEANNNISAILAKVVFLILAYIFASFMMI